MARVRIGVVAVPATSSAKTPAPATTRFDTTHLLYAKWK